MNAETAMLGERLKMARVGKGLSVQKAADRLHLDAWVIDALESDDYARIGPAVYGKGHLKRYAGLLQLPAAEVVEAYEARSSMQPAPASQAAATFRQQISPTPANRRSLWALLAALGAAACIAAGLLWWHARPPGDPTSLIPTAGGLPVTSIPPTEGAASAAASLGEDSHTRESVAGQRAGIRPIDVAAPAVAHTATPTAADTAAATAVSAAASVPATAPVGLRLRESSAGAGHARLRLRFSADSWVDVHDALGRRLFAGKGRANSVTSVAGEAPMSVYLGFASGVQLEVNSHTVAIGPQFVAGDVARFEAGADGVLRRDPHSASSSNPHPRG